MHDVKYIEFSTKTGEIIVIFFRCVRTQRYVSHRSER